MKALPRGARELGLRELVEARRLTNRGAARSGRRPVSITPGQGRKLVLAGGRRWLGSLRIPQWGSWPAGRVRILSPTAEPNTPKITAA